MEVIATICRKEKLVTSEPIAAEELYQDDNFQLVRDYAGRMNLPFCILSGRYGFISGQELVESYEQKLTQERVIEIVDRVTTQLREMGVNKLYFYPDIPGKILNDWPYYELLKKGCEFGGIEFVPIDLITLMEKR